jgi:hypothetical protein
MSSTGSSATDDFAETYRTAWDSNRLCGGITMKTNMNGDLEDIPMTYFWYPVLAIVAMVIGAVGVLIRLV